MTSPSPVPGAEPLLPPNVFQIRTFNDVVVLLYWVLPLLSTALVGYGVLEDQAALLWGGVVSTVLQLILQFARTQDFVRKAVYTTLNIINIVLVAYVAGWNPDALDSMIPLLNLILGGVPAAIASQNVNTSGDGTVPRAALTLKG